MFKPHRLKGGTFFWGWYVFSKKLPRLKGGMFIWVGTFLKNFSEGGGTFIWDGTFISHWIVPNNCANGHKTPTISLD